MPNGKEIENQRVDLVLANCLKQYIDKQIEADKEESYNSTEEMQKAIRLMEMQEDIREIKKFLGMNDE